MTYQRSQAEDVADGFYRIADMLRSGTKIVGIELADDDREGQEQQKSCGACLDGTPATHYHQLVGDVCDRHYAECRQLATGRKEHSYRGFRDSDDHHQTEVLVDARPLPMTELARRKSPSGFEWGYGGSGPAALAHSLLVYEFGEEADQIDHQDFKWAVVASLDYQGWTLTSEEIREVVAKLRLPTVAAQHPDPTC